MGMKKEGSKARGAGAKPTAQKLAVATPSAGAALEVSRKKAAPRGAYPFTSVELFSGCGGLALGTARAGFHHERLVEWNKEACVTLGHNKAKGVEHASGWDFVNGDVRLIKWSALGASVDLVAGGPPCQPFSVGGLAKGYDDARDMWPETIRAVRELKPRAFMFENVKGLSRPAFEPYLKWIVAHLAQPSCLRAKAEDHKAHYARLKKQERRAEYDMMVVKVNAADYGAPQKRHRVIIAGMRKDGAAAFMPPQPTHSFESLVWDKWISGDYWKRHGMPMPSASTMDEAESKWVEKFKKSKAKPAQAPWVTVRDALQGLGEPDGKNNHVLQKGAKAYPGHTGCPLDQPAKALKAGAHGVPGGENMMVKDDGSVRYFSVREAARLQGLPDDWGFVSAWGECMRQLGNAVPTQLSEALGQWMGAMLVAGASKKV
jgi:DNA (cytosine-5)-methyltransferase 1